MFKLFDRDKSVISIHIKNSIVEECNNVVVANFTTTTKYGIAEGKIFWYRQKTVTRHIQNTYKE